ncbi:four helix bundle protein [Candidatus Gracilibacteria bacterium]|nr:four helix bundle protein [Candidatus Gracilibacteria bacterium]
MTNEKREAKNIIRQKSYQFSLRIIKLYKFLSETKKEFVLAKQVLRCGTSIGANIEEAIGAQSKKDFFSKISIAYKEARETKYWLLLLKDSHILTVDESKTLLDDIEELLKIIAKIQITTKGNIYNNS